MRRDLDHQYYMRPRAHDRKWLGLLMVSSTKRLHLNQVVHRMS